MGHLYLSENQPMDYIFLSMAHKYIHGSIYNVPWDKKPYVNNIPWDDFICLRTGPWTIYFSQWQINMSMGEFILHHGTTTLMSIIYHGTSILDRNPAHGLFISLNGTLLDPWVNNNGLWDILP
jgi:hypothetical protein